MLIALSIGLIIGFLSCIPIGPVNVWVVNTLIKRDFNSAFAIALGGCLMDFIYFMIVLTGLSFLHFSPKIILFFKIVGVVFLFLFGLKELIVKTRNFNLDEHSETNKTTLIGFFLLGVVIYSSNPALIVSMSALAAAIKSWNLFNYNLRSYLSLSIGISLGSAFWFYLLLRIVKKYENKIPERFYANFSRVCGVLIVIISLYMAFKVYKENFA
ncbi:MAG: LysE family transporter [Bacteriovorax sp.]|nr:LysE family transporter [Bacteriovorax sp.]